jgi:dehydrogenase/reductase SDR family protein 1
MAPSLSGRIALVTGASRGIGRGIALQLGEAGATVYITGRKADDLEKTSEDIKARGGSAIPVVMDHSNDDDIENLFERIKREQGGHWTNYNIKR